MNDYYVYIWYNDDWGNIPIYVGKGKGNRWFSIENRSESFSKHISRWKCHSEIVFDELDEESAIRLEKKIKDGFIIEGYPILDAESDYRRRVSQSVGIRNAKLKGVKFGRPVVQMSDDFPKFLKKQKDGELTVAECCEQLGISRATWYNRLREVC